jgi:hypothetical protein
MGEILRDSHPEDLVLNCDEEEEREGSLETPRTQLDENSTSCEKEW